MTPIRRSIDAAGTLFPTIKRRGAMNWDAIGAVGQILGALAVFVSLGYLALQVKVANASARQSSQNALISDYHNTLQMFAQDPELTELIRRGANGGLEVLDGNEQTRFNYLMYSEYMRAQNMYRQLLSNQFDSHIARPLIVFFAQLCKTIGGSDWWRLTKGGADSDFVAHIDSLLANPKLMQLQNSQPWYARE